LNCFLVFFFFFCLVQHVDAAGTGPEYDYPTTEKNEPIPVVKDGEEVPLGGEGTEPVVGEDDRELTDAEIAGTTEKFFTLECMTHELVLLTSKRQQLRGL
jgi:hypothetical protein